MIERMASTRAAAAAEEPVVFIIDDDRAIREALQSLLRSVGFRVELFDSASGFMESPLPDAPSCIILDIRLPRLSGLDFQTELAKAGLDLPIIFVTGHGDIPMSVRAMKAGAVDFLTKPVDPVILRAKVSNFVEFFRQRERLRTLNNQLVDSRREL